MINQTQIIMEEMKLYVTQKYGSLIFVITLMFTFLETPKQWDLKKYNNHRAINVSKYF